MLRTSSSRSVARDTRRVPLREIRRSFLAGHVVLVGLAVACSGNPPPPSRPPARTDKTVAARATPARSGVVATRVTWVPPGTFGPHLGVKADTAVLAWAAERDGKRYWYTLALGKNGLPLSDPREVATATPEVDLVAVRPSGGTDSGYVLLATSREFSGERLDATGLGTRGELLAGPTKLAQSESDIVWIDSIPTAHGSLALWAVRRDDRADLYAVPLGVSGEPRERPAVLVSDAVAWQVAVVPNGVALAVLSAGKERGTPGPLSLVFSDEEMHVDKKLVLGDAAVAEADLDMVRVGDRLVVAFSDRSGLDPRITGVSVDLVGSPVKAATPLTPVFGPQALLRLVPPHVEKGPAYLVWENTLEQEPGKRILRVSPLSRDMESSTSAARIVARADASVPEFAATTTGVVGLAISSLCERGASCGDGPAVPAFVELDPTMGVVASEPVILPDRDAGSAQLAWGLAVLGDRARALVAGQGAPTPIYAATLESNVGRFESAARRVADLPLPRVEKVAALAKTEPTMDLSAARSEGGEWLAWVTDLDPTTPFVKTKQAAPDGKYEAARALLRVHVPSADGFSGSTTVLSYRAHSPGGVASSAGDPARGEALVAWTGVDNRLPQVFLTLVGKGGQKTLQKMLTHGKKNVSGVSLAFTGDGWIVAWSDERTGVSQIYLTKVDRTLKPLSTERALSPSKGAQTGVQLLRRGEHVFAVWSQAAEGGAADIFAARLSARDLGRIGPEHAIAVTEFHSRDAHLDGFGEGAVVTWVEEPRAGNPGIPTTGMVARLDSGAEAASGTPTPVSFPGSPSGMAVSCDGPVCRIAATVAREERGALYVFEWTPGTVPAPVRILPLEGRPRTGSGAVWVSGDIAYVDERAPRDARIRRIRAKWK